MIGVIVNETKGPYIPLDMPEVLGSKNKLLSLWHLMRGYHFHYLVSTIFLSLAAFARTGMYIYLGNFIDRMLDKKLVGQELTLGALTFGALIALQALSSFMSSWMANFTAENSTRRLRDHLFDHIQRLSYSYHSESKTGDLLDRATSDVDTLRRFFADQAIGVGRIVMIFIISFIAIARINLRLALVSIIIFPIVLVISLIFFKRLSQAYEAYQAQGAILSTDLQENLSGVRVVKAFARQEYEIEKFDKENREKLRLGKKFNWMHALFWPLSDIICSAQSVGSNFYAAMMVPNGGITLGDFISFHGLLGWLIWPIRNLGRLIIDTSRALVSYGRIAVVLQAPEEDMTGCTYQPEEGIRGQICFDKVSFAYEKDQLVLDDVSFSCQAGMVVALLGSTGSGKTSLVNLLPRFYDVTNGAIRLDGRDLRDYTLDSLRRQISIVLQDVFLFYGSVRDNILFGRPGANDEEMIAAARAANAHDFIMRLPDGYNTIIGERGVRLSGGQKQRLSIARAVLKNAPILILDEATSAVDTETEILIQEAIENLIKGRTTIIIAHRLSTVRRADNIIVLEDKSVRETGTHEQLMSINGLYSRLYNMQRLWEPNGENISPLLNV